MKNLYIILLIFSLFCLSNSLMAQNDNCASAPVIASANLNGGCINFNYGSPTPDPIAIYPCGHGAAQSYIWWRFTAQGTYLHLELDPGYEVAVVRFNGTVCADDPLNEFFTNCNNRITTNSLVVGQQYYIMVHNPSGGGSACLRVYNPQTPPGNDLCNNATNIVPHADNPVCINNYNFGTPLQDVANFSNCNGSTEINYNTWFRFTAHGPYLNIDGNPGVEYTIFDFSASGTCNYLAGVTIVNLECGFGTSYETYDLVPGNEYYVMVSSILSNFPVANFNMCIHNPLPPVNDECLNVINITQLDCQTSGTNYDFEWSTHDVGTIGQCGHDGLTPNIWFSFTAQGSYARIRGRAGFQFFLIDFTGVLCEAAGAFVLNNIECSEGVDVEFHDLELGRTYYIMVASVSGNPPPNVNLCVYNPPFPVNDEPCNAQTINHGQCLSGTTYSAYPEFTPGVPGLNCNSTGNVDDVWYTFTTGPRQYGARVQLNNLQGFNEQVMVAIYQYASQGDCSSLILTEHTPFPADCYPFSAMEFLHLYPNTQYFIRIFSSSSNDMGNFQICLNLISIPDPCSYSDNCANAIQVNLTNPFDPFGDCAGGASNPTGFSGCITSCNIGGTPEDPFVASNCIQRPWRTTWYRFNPQNYDFLNVTLIKDGGNPTIGVVGLDIFDACSGQSILAQMGLNCGFADEFTSYIDLNGIEIPNQYGNTDLYIVVGSSGSNTGHFELCVEVYDIVQGPDDHCAAQPSLIVPDADPPYSPGQTVNFTVTVFPYTQTQTIQWLQAIIPIFGEGWDPSSFQYHGGPPVDHTSPGGLWDWWDEGQVQYNYSSTFYTLYTDELGRLAMCHVTNCPPDLVGGECFVDGTKLPAGWYAVSQGGGPNCSPSGHPNDSWGDPSGPWTFTFSLTAREYDGHEGCSTTGYVDLGVEIYTLSDQQVGCWNNSNGADACRLDAPGLLEARNKCCKGPEINHLAEICSEGTFSYSIVTDQDFQDPDISFIWIANVPSGVDVLSGGISSNTRNISNTFRNNTTSPRTVVYNITALNSAGCDRLSQIEVTILPGLNVALADPDVLCPGESITLTPTVTGGNGIYSSYVWTPGGEVGSSYTFTPTGTTSIVVQVTDSHGCRGSDNVTVTVAQPFVANVASDKQAYCENEENREVFAPTPTTGEGAFSYSWGTIDGNFNQITQQRIKPLVTGTYSVTITDRHGCENTDEIDIVVYPSPTIVMYTQDHFCENAEWEEFSVAGFSTQGPVPVFYNHGGMFPNNGISAEYILQTFGPGPHSILLTATDELGCYAEENFVFTITPNPDVILPLDPLCYGIPVHILTPYPSNGIFSPGTIPYENLLPDGTLILVDLEPGTYDFYYEVFENGCSSIDTFEVEILPPVQLNITPGKDFTWNCNTQPFQIGATNGGMNFTWRGAEQGNLGTSNFIMVTRPDTLFVEGRDMEGCISQDTVFVLDDTTPPILSVDDTQHRLKCGDDLFGQIVVSVDGEDNVTPGNYTFTWSKISGEGSISGNTNVGLFNGEGVYRLHARSTSNHCDDYIEIEVFVDTLSPQLTTSEDISIDCISLEHVISTTFDDDYTYQWTTSGGSIDPAQEILHEITVNQPGTYFVEVTNLVNNCTSLDTVVVDDIRSFPDVDLISDLVFNCYDEGLDTIQVSTDLSFDIEWNVSDPAIIEGYIGSDRIVINQGGTIEVVVTNLLNGCATTQSINVAEDIDAPDYTQTPDFTLDCGSGSVSQIQVNTADHINISWTTENGNIITNPANTASIEVSGPGIYTFTLFDPLNGCSSTDEIQISENVNAPDLSVSSDYTIDCSSTLPVTLVATSTQGDQFLWSNADNNIPGGQETQPSISVSHAGTYSVTVTNSANGCSSTDIVVISDIREDIIADVQHDAVINCYNDGNTSVSISITSGAEDNNIQWFHDNNPLNSGKDLFTISTSEAGEYRVIVTNIENNCTYTETVIVTDNRQDPVANGGGDQTVLCSDEGQKLLTGFTNVSNPAYQWSALSGSIIGGSTTEASVLVSGGSGLYVFEVTDLDNGCVSTDTVQVNPSTDIPDIDLGADIIIDCETTLPVTISAIPQVATFEYSWTTISGTIPAGQENQPVITISEAGIYSLEVVDPSNDCKNNTSITVTDIREAPSAALAFNSVLNCFNQDTSGIRVDIFNVNNPDLTWYFNGDQISTGTNRIEIDNAGEYRVVVHNPENKCFESFTAVITPDFDAPHVNAGGNSEITCTDEGEITLTGNSTTNNVSYLWSTPNGCISGSPDQASITACAGGQYTLLVTDNSNGCTSSDIITVTVSDDIPVITASPDLDFKCSTTSFVLNATSNVDPSDATYTWTPFNNGVIDGTSTGNTITVTAPGRYVVEVINSANGCKAFEEVIVNDIRSTPHVDAGPDALMLCSDEGVKTITGSSNNTNVSYSWTSPTGGVILTNPATSTTIQIGSIGTFVLTVTDLNNDCTATDEVVITPDENIPDLSAPEELIINCYNEQTGIVIVSSSSVNGVTFEWTASNNGQISGPSNTPSVTAARPGIYTVLIENPENGCKNSRVVEVLGDFDQPVLDLGADQEITCRDQQATLSADSPDNVTYSWSAVSNGNIIGSTTGKNIIVDRIGQYRLTITDQDNGCVSEGIINVTSDDEYPHVNAGQDIVLGCEEFGIVQVTGVSNTAGVEYLWSSSSTFAGSPENPTITIDKPGVYTLRIYNPVNGCESFDSFEAAFTTDLPKANAGADREITCEDRDVLLDGTGSTGSNLSYSWVETGGNFIANPNSPRITVSTTGNYVLTVTNNLNGCKDVDNVLVTADPNVLSNLVLNEKDVRCYGENNGSVSILAFEGGVAPYRVLFEGLNISGNQINSLAPGIYTINVVDANGCELEKQVQIKEPDLLSVYIGETDTIKKGQSIHIVPILYSSTPITSFTWDTSTYLFCEGCPSITFAPEQSMRVTITVIDENGCTATHFKWIIVERDPHIYVPNVIAPNKTISNGNDKLIVHGGAEVKGFKSIIIFDRWGNFIYELKDFQSGNSVSAWDGTFRGKPVQAGVYVYTLTAIMQDDTEVQVNGDVTVLY